MSDTNKQEGVSIAERLKRAQEDNDELKLNLTKEVQDRTKETQQLSINVDHLRTQIASEITTRTTTDTQHEKELQEHANAIDEEVRQRQARNTEHDNDIIQLGKDLNKESAERERQDNALSSLIEQANQRILQETKDRMDADTTLTNRIVKDEAALQAETQNRVNDDKALNTRVDNVAKDLNTEAQNRESADQDEKNRAENAYPKKGGSGAYGTWAIDISGTAANATKAVDADHATKADMATRAMNDGNGYDITQTYAALGTTIVGAGTNWNTLTNLTTYKVQGCTMDDAHAAPPGEYSSGILVVDGIKDSLDDEHRINQIYYPHNPNNNQFPIWSRMRNGSDWTPWKAIASAEYVQDYAPAKNGFGAAGTWEIKSRNAFQADNATHADTATTVSATAPNGGAADLVNGTMAGNDYARIRVRGANDNGELEIATADDGTEPIYATQYTGAFNAVAHQITLMDSNGNTRLNNLTAGTVTATLNGDAKTVGGKTVAQVVSDAWPVGSIYLSVTNTNPSSLFGGTWKQISQGRFLLGAGSGYNAGTTGGEATHQLTVNELPSHSHSGTTSTDGNHHHGSWGENSSYGSIFGIYDGNNNHIGSSSTDHDNAIYNTSTNGAHNHTFTTDNTGSNGAHNNMPPYLVCYMWQRTA